MAVLSPHPIWNTLWLFILPQPLEKSYENNYQNLAQVLRDVFCLLSLFLNIIFIDSGSGDNNGVKVGEGGGVNKELPQLSWTHGLSS